jgi:hypothetical protein
LDLLGEQVIPVLRKEFDALRPAHVPDGPTHQGRLSALAPIEPVDQLTRTEQLESVR